MSDENSRRWFIKFPISNFQFQISKNITIALLLFVILSGFGCNNEKKVSETKFLLGTVIEITIHQADEKTAEIALKKAWEEINRVDSVFSHYKKDSPIGRINQNSGSWVDVPEEVIDLIEKSNRFSELTKGAFDISIGQIVNLWGFGPEEKERHVPSDKEISERLSLVDYRKIEIDKGNKKIRIKKGMKLDLGGIAKGYVLDRVVGILKKNGIKSALVNAGGDLFALGEKEKGKPFRIGIQHPQNEKEVLAVLEVNDMAVMTSGDYKNSFIKDGKRYHHIFNPKTGYPADLCRSVTIIAPNATDILSSGIFVLGPDEGMKLIDSLPADIGCIIVDNSGKIRESSRLRKLVSFVKQ